MSLTVIHLPPAVTALRHLHAADGALFARARQAIRALAADQYPAAAVPWGGSGLYRLHDGPLRIMYEADEAKGALYGLHVSVVRGGS